MSVYLITQKTQADPRELRRFWQNHTLAILRNTSGTRPEIRKISLNGETLAIKDYFSLARLSRSLGRVLVKREAFALKRLQNIRGVVPFRGTFDSFALATLFIEGTPLHHIPLGSPPRSFLLELKALVQRIHDSRFLLGDLKSSNVVMTPQKKPVLIDFASALYLPPLLHNYLKKLDSRKLNKILFEHAPELLSRREKKLIHYRFPLESAIRSIAARCRTFLRTLSEEPSH